MSLPSSFKALIQTQGLIVDARCGIRWLVPALLFNPERAKQAAVKSVETRRRKAAERALLRGEPASLPVKPLANGKQPSEPTKDKLAVDPRSERTRNVLAAEIEKQARMLLAEPCVTVGELLNNEGRVSRVAGVKSLVESAAVVFGWSKDGGANGLSSLRRFDEAIDVTPCDATETPASEPKAILDVPENTM